VAHSNFLSQGAEGGAQGREAAKVPRRSRKLMYPPSSPPTSLNEALRNLPPKNDARCHFMEILSRIQSPCPFRMFITPHCGVYALGHFPLWILFTVSLDTLQVGRCMWSPLHSASILVILR